MYYVGIDIGSTASKAVVLDEDKRAVLYKRVVPSGWNSKETGEQLLQWIYSQGFIRDQLKIIATGYGRVSVPYADSTVTEITCHGRGAAFLADGNVTVIDIGGQDSKALKLSDNGMLENFVMNDKCAAGTGRFLDVIAKVLEINLEDLEKLDEQSTKELAISSTCTVFAESEVISQLASGAKIPDIVKGIHTAIASRVGSLAKRVGIQDDVVMTGGVALNKGMVRALEKNIGFKIHTSEYCQLNGAIGAALFAYQKCKQVGK